MSKNYETQIADVKQKIKKLEAHLRYLEELKKLRDENPPSNRIGQNEEEN